MIATIRTWNGFHSGNNVTQIGNVGHLLHYFRNVIKLICLIVMHLLSAYIKNGILKCVLYSNLNYYVEETKFTGIMKVLTIPIF